VRIVPKNCRIILNVAALSLEVQHPLRRKGVPYELIIILARVRSRHNGVKFEKDDLNCDVRKTGNIMSSRVQG
jgi:hypothetical protein